jgi:hypothetical protein
VKNIDSTAQETLMTQVKMRIIAKRNHMEQSVSVLVFLKNNAVTHTGLIVVMIIAKNLIQMNASVMD